MNSIETINWSFSNIAAKALVTSLCALSVSTFAAQDGELGFESTGSIAIRLKIEQGVQITDLEDWDLTVSRDNTESDYQFVKDFCVRGTAGSRISVKARTDTMIGNKFALASTDNEPLAFQLEFNPAIASGQYEEISPVTGSSVYTIDSFNNCSTGNNSEIKIVFAEEDIMSAESLEFAGDLFITVELL